MTILHLSGLTPNGLAAALLACRGLTKVKLHTSFKPLLPQSLFEYMEARGCVLHWRDKAFQVLYFLSLLGHINYILPSEFQLSRNKNPLMLGIHVYFLTNSHILKKPLVKCMPFWRKQNCCMLNQIKLIVWLSCRNRKINVDSGYKLSSWNSCHIMVLKFDLYCWQVEIDPKGWEIALWKKSWSCIIWEER